MPVTYKIDSARGIIHTRCWGNVTLQEVLDHFHALEKDPSRPHRLDVFLDLREMTSSPSAFEIREAGDAVARLPASVVFGACAIVAERDAIYGLSRMWGVFVEPFFSEIVAFRTATEAEAWLEEKRADSFRNVQPTKQSGAA